MIFTSRRSTCATRGGRALVPWSVRFHPPLTLADPEGVRVTEENSGLGTSRAQSERTRAAHALGTATHARHRRAAQ